MQIDEEEAAKEAERVAALKQLHASSGAEPPEVTDDGGDEFVAYVPLPEQKEIEMRVMAKKKQELLAKYASEALIRQQEEAKQLLNVADDAAS